jgi:dihydroxyacetone kinase-like protein
MAEDLTAAHLRRWVFRFAELVADNRDHLTDLDAAIGDADHGANMHRGLQAVVAAVDDAPAAAGPLL